MRRLIPAIAIALLAAAPACMAAPANAAGIALQGKPVVGATLTAIVGGAPAGTAVVWKRCDGANCADVAGATAATYRVAQADLGSTLQATATIASADGTSTAVTSRRSAIVRGARPAIAGEARVGTALRIVAGTQAPRLPLASFQWLRCNGRKCTPTRARGARYVTGWADVGMRMVAQLRAGRTRVRLSTAPIAAVLPQPSLRGVALEGARMDLSLTASTAAGGSIRALPAAAQVRWLRCDTPTSGCAEIAGATAPRYVVGAADVGHYLRVTTWVEAAGRRYAETSSGSDLVIGQGDTPRVTKLPTIVGMPVEGSPLASGAGTWLGERVTLERFRWMRCNALGGACSTIAGATAEVYTPVAADIDHALRLEVRAANDAGGQVELSVPTQIVLARAPQATGGATIVGSGVVGDSMSVQQPVWESSRPVTTTVGWSRCDASGAACVPAGSGPDLVVGAGDVGLTYRVTVTASNTGGWTTVATAASAPAAARTSGFDALVDPAPSNGALCGTRQVVADVTGDGRNDLVVSCSTRTVGGLARAGAVLVYERNTANSGYRPAVQLTAQVPVADARCGTALGVGDVDGDGHVDIVVACSYDAGQAGTLQVFRGAAGGGFASATRYVRPVTTDVDRCGSDLAVADLNADGIADVAVGCTGDDTLATNAGMVQLWRGSAAGLVLGARLENPQPAAGDHCGVSVAVGDVDGDGRPDVVAGCDLDDTLAVDGGSAAVFRNAGAGAFGAGSLQLDPAAGASAQCGYAVAVGDVDGDGHADVSLGCPGGSTGSTTVNGYAIVLTRNAANTGFDAPVALVDPWAQTNDGCGSALAIAPLDGDARPDVLVGCGNDNANGMNAGTSLVFPRATNNSGFDGAVAMPNPLAEVNAYCGSSATVGDLNGDGVADVAQGCRHASAGASDAGNVVVATTAVLRRTAATGVAGVAREGSTLDGTSATWTSGMAVGTSRQWLRCDGAGANCIAIAGATGAAYVPVAADIGATLRLQVDATDGLWSGRDTSAATGVVSARVPVLLVAPIAQGVGTVNDAVGATPGTWTSSVPVTYAYQWQRCNGAGAACVDVVGATTLSLQPTGADLGSTFRVTVTATNSGGAVTLASAPTAPLTAPTTGYRELINSRAVATDACGTAVAVGDVNGDGRQDVVSGCPTLRASRSITSSGGALVYVRNAANNGFEAPVLLTVPSPSTNDFCGNSVAVGDVDGDGHADVVVGCYGDDTGGSGTGSAWVFQRNAGNDDFAAAVEVANSYAAAGDYCGMSVTVGDVNGDGRGDIVQGCYGDSTGASGAGSVLVRPRNATNNGFDTGWELVAPTPRVGAHCGTAVAVADVNGDGRGDVIGGCGFDTPGALVDAGSTVVFTRDVLNVAFDAGVELDKPTPAAGDRCGSAVSAGDLNGDGRADVVFGCFGDDGGATNVGAAIVYVRNAGNTGFQLEGRIAKHIPISGDQCGGAAYVGDVNADGRNDVMLGCTGDSNGASQAGAALIATRNAGNTGYDIALALNPAPVANDHCGSAVAAGDTDGDGKPDIVSGCSTDDSPYVDTGSVELTFGPILEPSPAPVLSGTPTENQTLSLSAGTWPASYGAPTYQWFRCDAAGANCANLGVAITSRTNVTADVGSTIKALAVRQSPLWKLWRGGTSAVIATAPPTNTVLPIVGGVFNVADEPYATNGTWTSSAAVTYAYQWRLCNAAGAACADIAGATARSYPIVVGNVGSTVRVVVTATNAGGSVSATSAASPVIGNQPARHAVLANPQPGPTTDRCGYSVATGDVNGDGLADVVSGCFNADFASADSGGAVVYTRTAGGGWHVDALVGPTTNNGDFCGASVAMGDFNGDGHADVVMGCTFEDFPAANTGTIVVFTRNAANTGFDPGVQLLAPAGAATDNCGTSLATGDFDGDGRIDIVTGCAKRDVGAIVDAGAPLVYLRNAANNGFDAGTWLVDGTPTTGASCGVSIAAADFNGDGRSDVVAGCSKDNTGAATAGEAVVFLRSAGNGGFDLGADLFNPTPAVADQCGNAVAAGDLTGDGRADVVMGCFGDDFQFVNDGSAMVFPRNAANTGFDAAMIGSQPAALANDECGMSLWVGDVDADGHNDLVMGCEGVDIGANQAGAVAVLLRTADGTAFRHSARFVNPAPGLNDFCGFAVAAGDVNGDGAVDVVTGCYMDDAAQTDQGSAFVGYAPVVRPSIDPALSGTQVEKQVLTATSGTWLTGEVLTPTYSWQRCDATLTTCTTIGGATASTYTLAAADVDQRIRAKVNESGPLWRSEAYTAATSAVAMAPPANTVAPTIVGSTVQGDTPASVKGTWTSVGAITYTYQWRRCDAAGANCVDIASATGPTYTLVAGDVGSTIRVAVTATNRDGATTLASAQTAVVTAPPATYRELLNTKPVGTGAADRCGFATAAGDVNGDGRVDLVVGCYAADHGAADAGSVLVYLRNATNTGYHYAVALTHPTPLLNDFCGYAVAVADVNGDGNADVVMGCYGDDTGAANAGEVVVFTRNAGNTGFDPGVELSNPTPVASDQCGIAVAAGDVNGDGRADVLMGCNFDDQGATTNTGEMVLFTRNAGNTAFDPGVEIVNPTPVAGDQCGVSVAIGDVNADARGDLVMGCTFDDTTSVDSGNVIVYTRNALNNGFNAAVEVANPAPAVGDGCGSSVKVADINADTYGDLVVGCSLDNNGATADTGSVFVIPRNAGNTGFAAGTQLLSVAPTASDQCGVSVSVGDVNADGKPDVVFGCHLDNTGAADAGSPMIALRNAANTGFLATTRLTNPSPVASDWCGHSVTAADVNGDGKADVVAGCDGDDTGAANTGDVIAFLS